MGRQYTIDAVGDDKLNSSNLGCCNSVQQRISVDANQGHGTLRDTVLHELLHAIDFTVCADMKEHQIHTMAGGLLAVMLDNPHWVAWMMEREE